MSNKVKNQDMQSIIDNSACSQFCEDITNGIGGFKMWEDREFVSHTDRDKAIVEWTIRCLANPLNPLSMEVLNEINKQRLKIEVPVMNLTPLK